MEDQKGCEKYKFAVLITGPTPSYCEQMYGHFGRVFANMLKDDGEDWDSYEVMNNVFPTDEQAESYHGFVVTGSRFSAHDNLDWMVRLKEFCRQMYDKNKKIVGICFGHQLLSNAFGGESGRAPVGWEVGVKELHPTVHFAEVFPQLAELHAPLNILESHRDQVLRLPPDAVLLASSDRTPIEMYTISDRVLCMQGHPECTPDIVRDLIETRKAVGVVPSDVADEALATLDRPIPADFYRTIIRTFLKA
eukprot:TRINITY_DN12695_c0_g1_i5.p1 TRINITY_DN12695_c0_g1~~TRINITY_DN12695_c0_g1_i5.p1  ORF type:complete len:269 (+),score=78.25 TRINITY_DN12695_c0_g1_i5:61-807(+)